MKAFYKSVVLVGMMTMVILLTACGEETVSGLGKDLTNFTAPVSGTPTEAPFEYVEIIHNGTYQLPGGGSTKGGEVLPVKPEAHNFGTAGSCPQYLNLIEGAGDGSSNTATLDTTQPCVRAMGRSVKYPGRQEFLDGYRPLPDPNK